MKYSLSELKNYYFFQLTVEDLSAVIEIGKANFKTTPLVWLKGLASYLNVKLSVEHFHQLTNFSTKSFDHPLCLLPTDIRNLIKKEIKDVHDSYSGVVQTLFDFCLTSMAVDMAKGKLFKLNLMYKFYF